MPASAVRRSLRGQRRLRRGGGGRLPVGLFRSEDGAACQGWPCGARGGGVRDGGAQGGGAGRAAAVRPGAAGGRGWIGRRLAGGGEGCFARFPRPQRRRDAPPAAAVGATGAGATGGPPSLSSPPTAA